MKFYLFFIVSYSLASFISDRRLRACGYLLTLFLINIAMSGSHDKLALFKYSNFFLAGIIVCELHLAFKQQLIEFKLLNTLIFFACLLFLLSHIPPVWKMLDWWKLRLWNSIYLPVICGILIISSINMTEWAKNLFANPVMRFLGKISFSLYLVHLPLFRLVKRVNPFGKEFILDFGFILGFGVSVLVSTLLFYALESPLNVLGHRWARQLKIPKIL